MSGSQSNTNAPPTIDFSEIPANWQVPGSNIEVKAGYGSLGLLPFPARILVIGQLGPGSTAAAGVIITNVTSALSVRGLVGPGSMLDRMLTLLLPVSGDVPVDVLPIADANSSTAAQWAILASGTVSSASGGTLAFNVAGTRVTQGCLPGDTAATDATELAASINANPLLPVTAVWTGPTGLVTVTAKNKGLAGNDILIVPNPLPGDTTPPGLTVTVTQTVQGATNPALSGLLTAFSNAWYTDIVMPWQDSANVASALAESERRFLAMIRKDVRIHYGITGTYSQQLSAAANANGRFLYASPMYLPQTEPYVIAAVAAGICASQLTNDPSLQLDQIAMPGVVGPMPANLPDDNEKQMLLVGGCSVFRVERNGTVTMERYVSTYTTNAQGMADTAWHDVMEQAVASRIRYDWRVYFRTLYPANKLAPDGSLAAQNANVVTPKRAAASWAARLTFYARLGWVVNEAADAQTSSSTFQIDPNDPNTLQYQLYYTRIGNLIDDAGQLIFNQ
jgi:phage tail sheath gpL-like